MATSFDVTTKRQVNWTVLPLDPNLFWILDTEKAFFKAQTGIENDEELRSHILRIQQGIYSVLPYPCIRLFSFLRLNITRGDAYTKVLKLGQNRQGAIFLEIGPGFGTDIRKLIYDGYPVENVVATDLHESIWTAGHQLFKSTPERFPITFVPGDIFKITEGLSDAETALICPDLAHLSSFLKLKGHVSVIYTALFFHLFDEKRGNDLAERLVLLLSPEKGSIIFGIHLGAPEAGLRTTPAGTMFCHSPETWKILWENLFSPGEVRIQADLLQTTSATAKAYAGEKRASDVWTLIWSIERL